MDELPGGTDPTDPSADDRNLAMLVHVGTLAALLIGGWGLHIAVPLVGYLWKRESSTFIAEHAREELNFQISLTIYVLVAGLLALLTLGLGLLVLVPLGLVVGIVALVVMIRAALAASRGERYRYPMTMRFVS
jgi:uncharacterized Tic20 family protein